MKFDLVDRTVLLTGATGYLGREIAAGLVDCGARVLLAGRTLDHLEILSRELAEEPGQTIPLQLDMSSADSLQTGVEWMTNNLERLDGIVNAAYHGRTGTLSTLGFDDFELAFRLNVSGPAMLVRATQTLLERSGQEIQGGASVVNISSMYGKVSPDRRIYSDKKHQNPVHYGASKAGMIQLSRYLACELARSNIRVNSVSPGPFPNVKGSKTPKDLVARLENKVPMGRIGDPSEIAGPVLFLLSPASSYVTGIDLPVDGGWTAW